MTRLALVASVVGAMSLVAEEGCSSTSTGAASADGSVEATTVVADAQSDAPIACTQGYDCSPLFSLESSNQSSVPCCAAKVCRLEAFDDGCTDAGPQRIQASSYDQSCTTDKDCVAVAEGNLCYPGAANCPNATISKSAYAQYQADYAKTRSASCYAPGNCGGESGPCCVAGKCQVGSQCSNPTLTDAAADTGADSAIDGGGADAASEGGPLDARGE